MKSRDNSIALPVKPAVEALIILIFALGLYANTLNHGFVLDDMMMITHNEFTKQGFSGMGKILTNDAFTGFHGEDKNLLPGGRYRPLSQLMFAAEYGIFGENPFPGHLINILLYALACLLVYKALLLLFQGHRIQLWRFSLAFIIALLFAVHPLHTESVANIKGRDEILSLIGFAVTAILALHYLANRKPRYLLLITPVFFLSMLAKESALTWLAAVPLLILYRQQRFSKEMLNIFLSLMAGLGLYLVLRIAAIGIPPGGVSTAELLNDPFLHASFPEKIATLLFTWIKYVGLILFPHPLTHDYYPWHITYKSLGNGLVLLSLVFFVGMAIYALKRFRKPDMLAAGFMLFVILFSSQSNLLVNIGSFMNERFVFIAMLGILLMLGWLLVEWLPAKTGSKGALSVIVISVLLIGFSLKTISRNGAWKDDFTLFTTDVNVSENSAKVNISAGGVLLERSQKADSEVIKSGYLNRALPYLERGTRLHPAYFQGQLLLGNARMLLNDFQGALDAYQVCLRMNPGNSDVINNTKALGKKATLYKDHKAAMSVFATLVNYQPGDAEIAAGYAEALMENLEIDKAHIILDSLSAIYPENSNVNHLLGQLWGRYKAFEPGADAESRRSSLNKARTYLQKAVEAEPENYGMIENLAIVHGISGDMKGALALFHKALDLMIMKEPSQSADVAINRAHNENLYRIYKNIGDTYGNMRDMKNLRLYYEKALTHNPDDPVLVTTLAGLYNSMGEKSRGSDLLADYLSRNPQDMRAAAMLEQLNR